MNDTCPKDTPLFTTLRERRESVGVSVSDLARRLGWSKAYVSMLERGIREMSSEAHHEMSKALKEFEREREEREPAVRRAVDAAFSSPKLQRLRREYGVDRNQAQRNDS